MRNADLYSAWLAEHGIEGAPIPDESGLFDRGTLRCVLPFLLAYWRSDQDRVSVSPPWETKTWVERAEGWVRFLRADQMLDWIATLFPPDKEGKDFAAALKEALDVWLVPIDDPLVNRPGILDQRVEAIRVWLRDGRLTWSRRADWFPDELRRKRRGWTPSTRLKTSVPDLPAISLRAGRSTTVVRLSGAGGPQVGGRPPRGFPAGVTTRLEG